MVLAGVDGCKYGWVLVKFDGVKYSYGGIYKEFQSLIDENPEISKILIDIPIGLSSSNKLRTLDKALRNKISRRSSSVFNAPCRKALLANNYHEAKEINKTIEGKGLSKQTYFIQQKIHEVDCFLQANRNWLDYLLESHPEFCFFCLSGGKYLDKKSTAFGVEQRKRILQKHIIEMDDVLHDALNNTLRKELKIDDVLDAMCLCLINQLGATDKLSFINDPLGFDEFGIPMKIAYYKC